MWFINMLDSQTQETLIDLLNDDYLTKNHILVNYGKPQQMLYFNILGNIEYATIYDDEIEVTGGMQEEVDSIESDDRNRVESDPKMVRVDQQMKIGPRIRNDKLRILFTMRQPSLIAPWNLLCTEKG